MLARVGQMAAHLESAAVATALTELAEEIRLEGEPVPLLGNTLRRRVNPLRRSDLSVMPSPTKADICTAITAKRNCTYG
ncbi:UNVERIFIED_CONTAM: hypothetical protein RKD50_009377 [Streptomyces canus]